MKAFWRSFAAALTALLCIVGHAGAQNEVTRFQLENGLHVILKPLENSPSTALVTCYSFGNLSDPEGQSGLSHLAEHLYVSAATDQAPARSAESFAAAHPAGWNAQTGDDYTVFATVFPNDMLAEEIADAAARMRSLKVSEQDLQREVPRIQGELENMYHNMPALLIRNWARHYHAPLAHQGQRGGIIEQVKSITVDRVQAWLDAHYKPANAVLTLVGKFDPDEIRQTIEHQFGSIPGGTAPATYPAAVPDGSRRHQVTYSSSDPAAPVFVVFAVTVPHPADPHYPAFLVQAMRLQRHLRAQTGRSDFNPIILTPLDDPEFLYLIFPHDGKAKSHILASELNRMIDDQLHLRVQAAEKDAAKNSYGFLLGLVPIPPLAEAQNPYGVAFSLARQHQMQYDPQALGQAFDELDDQAMSAMAEKFFGREARTILIVDREPK